jgi:hypothetical protein
MVCSLRNVVRFQHDHNLYFMICLFITKPTGSIHLWHVIESFKTHVKQITTKFCLHTKVKSGVH